MPLAWRSDSVAPRAGSTAGLEVVRKLPQSKADRKPAGAQRTNVEEFPEVTKEPGAFAHGAQLLLLWLTKERENKGQSADRSDQRLAGVDPVVDEGGAAIPVPLYSAAVSDAPPPPPPRGHERRPGIAGASPRIDGLAYAALVMGILSLVSSVVLLGSGLLLGPVAAIMGFISRRRIAASPGTLGGGGVALAGLILGIIGFVVGGIILVLAFWVAGLFQCGPADVHQPGLQCP